MGVTHGGESAEKKGSQGSKAFKKKSTKSSYVDKKNKGVPELLRGLNLCISRDVPEMYLKAVKRLGLLQECVRSTDMPRLCRK